MSAFWLALKTVVGNTVFVWPSPKLFCPVQTFQWFEEEGMQGSSSGMALLALF